MQGAGFRAQDLPFMVHDSGSNKIIGLVRSWFSMEGFRFGSWDREGRREAVHVDPLVWGLRFGV